MDTVAEGCRYMDDRLRNDLTILAGLTEGWHSREEGEDGMIGDPVDPSSLRIALKISDHVVESVGHVEDYTDHPWCLPSIFPDICGGVELIWKDPNIFKSCFCTVDKDEENDGRYTVKSSCVDGTGHEDIAHVISSDDDDIVGPVGNAISSKVMTMG